jgi:AraC-like DNA-binding protein
MLTNANKPTSTYVKLAIEGIKLYIDEYPLRHKTSGELLDHLNTPDRSSIEKAFKNNYGYGIKEYQVRQRLEASKKFLEQGMTKKLVATKCFYKGQATYCRAFKQAFNITPTEWQNLHT